MKDLEPYRFLSQRGVQARQLEVGPLQRGIQMDGLLQRLDSLRFFSRGIVGNRFMQDMRSILWLLPGRLRKKLERVFGTPLLKQQFAQRGQDVGIVRDSRR